MLHDVPSPFSLSPPPPPPATSSGYFVAMAISGIFSATFSIAFAYVADSTCENERSFSYGVVSRLLHVVRVLCFGYDP